MNELTIPEQSRLAECEAVIERGLQTFVEVGIALAEIRESRLYRLTHGTFEEYCGERWQIGRRQADRLIAGAETVENLRPTGLIPQSERVVRPLTHLEPELQPIVWQKSVSTAPNGKVTAAHVQATAKTFQATIAAAPVPALTKPHVIPSSAAVINMDSRNIAKLGMQPVHLVVTSPPYNVGIDYGEHDDNLSQDEYLDLIEDVFRACYDVMIDGARIAVNVPFGVGRNPWVPFAARIMDILDAIGFTLRGQIIWDKGNSGNRTSWGSFRLPSDPSLRDTTEAIIVAHRGGSKLSVPNDVKLTDDKGAYTPALADSSYFMELAQDHWVVAPESARRIGHPAPFPTALAKRLIDLYAYPGAHVLDPFAGSGSTGVAAIQAQCSVTLIEVDPVYCRMIEERLSHD